MATINMHMRFEIEIPQETWHMLRKPCRLQTDGRTDGQVESSIPPSNFVGRGYNNWKSVLSSTVHETVGHDQVAHKIGCLSISL